MQTAFVEIGVIPRTAMPLVQIGNSKLLEKTHADY
jgi:hypothetical protein